MAQLKSTVISGSLRVTDTTYTTNIILSGSQTKNFILAAPSNAAGAPTFRALVADDIPSLAASKISSGTLDAARIPNLNASKITAGTLPVARGGTGTSTAPTANGVIYASSTSEYASTAKGANNAIFVASSTGVPSWKATGNGAAYATGTNAALTFGTLPVAQGGTGATTFTANAVLCGNGTNAITAKATAKGAAYATAANGALSFGTLPIAEGGTGTATAPTQYGVIYASSTTAYASTAKGANNAVFVANASGVPSWKATASGAAYATAANGALTFGTLPIAQGGTGLTSATPHTALMGPATGTTNAAPTWRKPRAEDLDYYTGTQTAQVTTSPYQSALWKFNAGRSATSFTSGDIILIKTPGTGGSYGVFVSFDNGTTYRPLCLATTGRYTTHFTANVVLALVYDSAGQANSIYGTVDANGNLSTTTGTNNVTGGCWRVMNLYDSGNSNDTGTLVRDYGGNVPIVTVTAATYRYQLLFSVKDTNAGWKVVPANTTSNSTATSKTTIFTSEFNVFGDIYYYNQTGTINANATIRADYLWKSYPLTLSYSFNCGSTLTAGKDVYLVAKMVTSVTAKLRNPGATGTNAAATATGANAGPITQTLPTTCDGFIYIRLGRAYNTSAIDLALSHPIYYHDGTSLQILSQSASYGTSLPSTGYPGQIFYQTSDPLYELPAGGSTGQVLAKRSATARDVQWVNMGGVMTPNTTTTYYVTGSSSTAENSNAAIFNTAIKVQSGVLYGAAWNDYAEFRRDNWREKDKQEPGRCVRELGNGVLELTTKRLQMGCEVISDTFGFAIGEDEEHNTHTPIAIAGRVLAYPFESLEEFKAHIGWPVCSGPNGTVSIMTRYEERNYPSRIVGTISEVPLYKTWGSGNVAINGRVWIRVR